jgi:hypothetical protein
MKKLSKTVALSSLLVTSIAQADIAFNGFASIVGGLTTSSDTSLQGYDDSIDFSNGSLFALQASSDLGNGLGVTAQIVSRGSNDWDPDFEWAYISYDATDNLRFLAGRQRAPFYMYSDFLDVSYAYAWITPPEGVYDLIFDTFDGLGAVYSTSFGEFDTNFQFMYGRNTEELNISGTQANSDFTGMFGGSITLNREWLTLRAGYFQADMNIPVDGFEELAAGWTAVGFDDIASNVVASEDTVTFVEAGFQIDHSNIIVVGEYTKLTLDDTPFANEESYYVMAGYQFDSVLLHVTYGADENSKDDITSAANYVIPATNEYEGTVNVLKATTQFVVNDFKDEQSYITIGARWDFHDSAALKFEYTDFTDDLNGMNDTGLFRTALVTVF